MHTPRRLCFLATAVLYGIGLFGVVTLGDYVRVPVALMLIAFGSAFLIAGLVLGPPRRPVPNVD